MANFLFLSRNCDVLSRIFAERVLDGRLVCKELCLYLSLHSSLVLNVDIGIDRISIDAIPDDLMLQERNVVQLRRLCSSLKICAGGKKCELIARLSDFRGKLTTKSQEKQICWQGTIMKIFKEVPHIKTRLHLTPCRFSLREINRLLGSLSKVPNLTELSLLSRSSTASFAKLGAVGFETLTNKLKYATSLTSIKLHGVHPVWFPDRNPLASASAAVLGSGLINTPLLRILDLTCMVVSDDCAALIFEGLRHTPLLTSLNLEGNRITEIGAEHLARALRHTPMLRSLLLTNLTFMESTIQDPVCLGAAGARHIADGLSCTPLLTSLDICRARIGDQGAASLAAALCHVPKLTSLDVSDNDFSPDGSGSIISALQYTPRITALDISDALGDEVATQLAAALHHVPLLTNLRADRCGISSRGAEALGRALPVLPGLAKLSLRSNSLGHGAEALLAGATGLRDLKLSGLDPTAVSALCRGLRSTTALTRIDLDWSDLRGGGAQTLARSLQHAPLLVSLNLSGMKAPLDSGGAEPLSMAIRHAPGLTSLNAEYHNLGPEGVATLVAELRRAAPRLVTLILRENSAGDAGAEAVAEALPHWQQLRMLLLDSNGIGDAGAARLADALPSATALTWLNLKSNFIGGLGARRLVAAQRATPRLHTLQIG